MSREGSPFTVQGSGLVEKASGLDFFSFISSHSTENKPPRRLSGITVNCEPGTVNPKGIMP